MRGAYLLIFQLFVPNFALKIEKKRFIIVVFPLFSLNESNIFSTLFLYNSKNYPYICTR